MDTTLGQALQLAETGRYALPVKEGLLRAGALRHQFSPADLFRKVTVHRTREALAITVHFVGPLILHGLASTRPG